MKIDVAQVIRSALVIASHTSATSAGSGCYRHPKLRCRGCRGVGRDDQCRTYPQMDVADHGRFAPWRTLSAARQCRRRNHRLRTADLLAVTWEFGGEVSWLTVRLSQTADHQTLLELEHIAHVDDERWRQFGPGAVGVGWDMALMGLGQHLATGASADPKAAIAWLSSPDGKIFVAQSSDDWARASVAAGTEASQAKAAAARTTAAYSGGAPSED